MIKTLKLFTFGLIFLPFFLNAQEIKAEPDYLSLIEYSILLEKEWDDEIAIKLVEKYSKVSREDKNPHVIETFGGLIEKNEEAVIKIFKNNLSKEEYKLFKSNLFIHKREAKEGNG